MQYLVHDTEQRPRVTSVLVPSPRLWTGLRVGQSLNPVLPALCFSQSSGLWPGMEALIPIGQHISQQGT